MEDSQQYKIEVSRRFAKTFASEVETEWIRIRIGGLISFDLPLKDDHAEYEISRKSFKCLIAQKPLRLKIKDFLINLLNKIFG